MWLYLPREGAGDQQERLPLGVTGAIGVRAGQEPAGVFGREDPSGGQRVLVCRDSRQCHLEPWPSTGSAWEGKDFDVQSDFWWGGELSLGGVGGLSQGLGSGLH